MSRGQWLAISSRNAEPRNIVLQDLLGTLPASITTLYQRLREQARRGPRLSPSARPARRHLAVPAQRRQTMAGLHRPQPSPAFRLWPFEIPTVDRVAVYGVLLLGRHGLIARPEALLDGIALDPVLEHPSEGTHPMIAIDLKALRQTLH